jgi:hypothetical protein
VNFSRVEYRTTVAGGAVAKAVDAATGKPYAEDNWVWTPTGLVNIHYPEMWGYVQFSGKTAGQGRDAFTSKPEEKAKWALRRIYYREWAIKAEKGSFAADLKVLGLKDKDLKISKFVYPPVIQSTDSQFEASYTGEDGVVWRITQDGRVRKDQ